MTVGFSELPVLGDLLAEQWSADFEAATAELVVRNVGVKPTEPTVVRTVEDCQRRFEGAVSWRFGL